MQFLSYDSCLLFLLLLYTELALFVIDCNTHKTITAIVYKMKGLFGLVLYLQQHLTGILLGKDM